MNLGPQALTQVRLQAGSMPGPMPPLFNYFIILALPILTNTTISDKHLELKSKIYLVGWRL